MIGILAVQGDFAAHGRVLDRLGVQWREVRSPAECDEVSGLIMPGGESTTMLKFLNNEGFIPPLKALSQRGGSLMGTCAGAILLAREVSNPAQSSLGLIDMAIARNAYGRQVDSFVGSAAGWDPGSPPMELVFIRAPIILQVGPEVRVLAEHRGRPVLVQQGRHLAATFHPELTADTRVHQCFLNLSGIF
jgi:5'-phosphate synthase pdxT subunit